MASTIRLCWALLLSATALAVDVSVPLKAPSTAPTVPPTLISLSIEQDRWTEWAGTTSRNEFVFNTLDNINQIAGSPPHIRIGADSEDHTDFSPNVEFSEAIFPNPTTLNPYPEALNITVGNGFYRIVSHLPRDTHIIWGVNLGHNNITAAVLEAKAIADAFKSPAVASAGIVLDFIEIGNEADLYRDNGFRSPDFNVSEYVKEWTVFATDVVAAAGISKTSHTKLIGGAFALSSHTATGFSPQGIFDAGILASEAGSLMTTISQHIYSTSFSGTPILLQDLVSKTNIRGNISAYIPDMAAVHARGLGYILGETNNIAAHGAPGVSNTAGAALWTLDYALFAAQLGIPRAHFHNGIGFMYNLIQPVTLTRSTTDGAPIAPLAPHVQPQYYAAIIAAEAIGKSGSTRIVELAIDDPHITGYAFFEGNDLARALFINLDIFQRGDTSRNTAHLDISFAGAGAAPNEISLKTLAIGHADDTAGLTFGGQTYETSDGRVSGKLVVTRSTVGAGIDLRASEAVLVSFK